jgi:DamX protein
VGGVLAQVAQLALVGQEAYLLVDDAEQLDDLALAELLALAVGNAEGRPHVFLFGQSSLIPRLERLSAGEERFHAIELQPYSEEETREYLAQRLEGAGQGIELLTAEQIEDIHQQSGGWPGAINEVARDMLVEIMLARQGAARGRGFALGGLPVKHLLALLVVAVGVGAAWLMQGDGGREATIAPVTTQLPMNPAVPAAPATAVQESEGPAIEFDGAAQPLPLPLVGEAQPVIRQPLAQAASLDEEDGREAVEELPVPVAVAPAPAPAPVPTPAPAPVAPVVPVAAPAVAPASKPAPVAASVGSPAAKPVASAQPDAVSGNWYRSQSSSNYALQIFGSRSESSAQALVRELGGESRYFKKMHQGQPLFVVTYGSFGSRDAAQAAIKSLPAKVQAGKPWPRTFASIQQEAL